MQVKELLDPFYHTYVCQDGRSFYVVAPCHHIHQQRVLEALGVWHDMLKHNLPVGHNVYAESDEWGTKADAEAMRQRATTSFIVLGAERACTRGERWWWRC